MTPQKRQFLKPNPADFDQSYSFDVKLMYNKVHQILCRYLQWFWSYSEKNRRGQIPPPPRAGAQVKGPYTTLPCQFRVTLNDELTFISLKDIADNW